jgi:hypothetical protein
MPWSRLIERASEAEEVERRGAMSAWQQRALPPWLLALVRGAKLDDAVAQEANDGLASAEVRCPRRCGDRS